MRNEQEFYEALHEVPPMPDLYPGIIKRVSRHRLRVRAAVALAAAIVLAVVGVAGIRESAKPVSPELAEALGSINDYCNGNDIPEIMASYSLVQE